MAVKNGGILHSLNLPGHRGIFADFQWNSIENERNFLKLPIAIPEKWLPPFPNNDNFVWYDTLFIKCINEERVEGALTIWGQGADNYLVDLANFLIEQFNQKSEKLEKHFPTKQR